ncbi:MAG: transposase [Pseudomonadota bacterium]|nr:transposase [Pseudomonadota bacterium]
MTNWRRAYIPGGVFFFTLVTEHRSPILTTPRGRGLLREVTVECRGRFPFEVVAAVLLPDHLHAIWRLPHGDSDYSKRWAWLKKEFTKRWLAGGGAEQLISDSRQRNRRRGVLQRRFWEHVIRDERDLERHVDYIHYNPVKHGYVTCPVDWQWSSFHRFVRDGAYPRDWGCAPLDLDDMEDTVGE